MNHPTTLYGYRRKFFYTPFFLPLSKRIKLTDSQITSTQLSFLCKVVQLHLQVTSCTSLTSCKLYFTFKLQVVLLLQVVQGTLTRYDASMASVVMVDGSMATSESVERSSSSWMNSSSKSSSGSTRGSCVTTYNGIKSERWNQCD